MQKTILLFSLLHLISHGSSHGSLEMKSQAEQKAHREQLSPEARAWFKDKTLLCCGGLLAIIGICVATPYIFKATNKPTVTIIPFPDLTCMNNQDGSAMSNCWNINAYNCGDCGDTTYKSAAFCQPNTAITKGQLTQTVTAQVQQACGNQAQVCVADLGSGAGCSSLGQPCISNGTTHYLTVLQKDCNPTPNAKQARILNRLKDRFKNSSNKGKHQRGHR